MNDSGVTAADAPPSGRARWRRRTGPFYGLFVALQFMTRIPMPRNLDPRADDLGRSAVFFPIVGLIVGLVLGLVALLLIGSGAEPLLAAVLVASASIALTGAFHEDGAADSADGLGGGFTREDSLRIMRDSRIGTYGAVTLWTMLTLRAAALATLAPAYWLAALVAAHVLARTSSLPLIAAMPYARELDSGHGASKPLIEGMNRSTLPCALLLAAAALALIAEPVHRLFILITPELLGAASLAGETSQATLPFLMIPTLPLLTIIGVALGITALAGLWLHRKIGGITGDALGLVNITIEVAILIVLAILL